MLLMCGVAYSILAHCLIAHRGRNSQLARALGKDAKGWLSIALYLVGIGLSFLYAWLGFAVYIGVAIMWLIPDRRIEAHLGE